MNFYINPGRVEQIARGDKTGMNDKTYYYWKNRFKTEGVENVLSYVRQRYEIDQRIKAAQADIMNPDIPSPEIDKKYNLRPGYTNTRRFILGIKPKKKRNVIPQDDNPSFDVDFNDNGYFSIEKWAEYLNY